MAVVDEDVPQFVDTGFTTINPVSRVVRLTHSRWPIAARESASAVSGDERAADG
jgi:hypothetical protein